MTDWQLLVQYLEQNSDEAFAALVQRHVNMVYGAARRQTRDSHLAEDVTQAVFILLARRARDLKESVVLAGWLYQAARLSASTALRQERRRQGHERLAAEAATRMRSPLEHGSASGSEDPETIWNQIAPALDDAMGRLGHKDRDAIVLRFLQGKSMAETGKAIGVSEQAPKMRVHRAVERLRQSLARAGIGATSAVLIPAITSAATSQSAPARL